MDIDEFQAISNDTILPEARELRYLTLGLTGEAGEVANVIKKIYRNNSGNPTPEQITKIIDELGDVLWYVAMIAEMLQTDLSKVAYTNINKLQARKMEGGLRHE